jgi:hypothetical protein
LTLSIERLCDAVAFLEALSAGTAPAMTSAVPRSAEQIRAAGIGYFVANDRADDCVPVNVE